MLATLRDRFEAKVDRSAGPDGCHLWTAAVKGSGYGWIGFDQRRGSAYAHRVAWMLANGDVELPSLCVLHRCDNRLCVNPAHLFLGTRRDNDEDMAKKWRGRRAALPFGAHPQPRGGRFIARLTTRGKQVYLGTYDTPEEASAVAVAAKCRLYDTPPPSLQEVA